MNDWLKRAQRGDSEAFVELFERHKTELWKAAVAVLGNVDDAADALQDTTLKAWQAIPQFEGRSEVGTWLMRILLRTCFDMRRRCLYEIPSVMQEEEASEAGWAGGQIATDDARAIAGGKYAPDRDEALDVRSSVGQLCVDDQLILTLAYVHDYSTRHIAEILNISEGAVRTRLTRARDRFKAVYLQNNKEIEVIA